MNREELIEALSMKLRQLKKMRDHLGYSVAKVGRITPLPKVSEMTPDELESLAALKGRFGELQDHLASAMKLIASIEGENTDAFTYVLQFMVKLGALDDAEQWQHARDIRNAAAHEYSDDEDAQVVFYQTLHQLSPYLFDVCGSIERTANRLYPMQGQS